MTNDLRREDMAPDHRKARRHPCAVRILGHAGIPGGAPPRIRRCPASCTLANAPAPRIPRRYDRTADLGLRLDQPRKARRVGLDHFVGEGHRERTARINQPTRTPCRVTGPERLALWRTKPSASCGSVVRRFGTRRVGASTSPARPLPQAPRPCRQQSRQPSAPATAVRADDRTSAPSSTTGTVARSDGTGAAGPAERPWATPAGRDSRTRPPGRTRARGRSTRRRLRTCQARSRRPSRCTQCRIPDLHGRPGNLRHYVRKMAACKPDAHMISVLSTWRMLHSMHRL